MALLDDQIMLTAQGAAISAIQEYERISKADPSWMPEYWIICRIASELAHQGMMVDCEKRISELIGGDAERLGGRVDLAVYKNGGTKGQAPRALIEVKGPRTSWSSFPEAFARLRNIAKLLHLPGLIIGLVYGTPPMSESRLDKEEALFKQWLPAEILGRNVADILEISPRFRLEGRHADRTPGDNDAWELMSVFDAVSD